MAGIAIVVALLMLQGGPATANTGLRAVYDLTREETSPAGDGASGEKVTRVAGTVRIAANVLALREGDDEHIYDFAKRRVIVLDHARKEAHELSLYAFVGLREIELAVALSGELMGAPVDPVDVVDLEIYLGMRSDPLAKVRLEEQRRDGSRVFVLNGREVTAFLGADRPLPPSLTPMLARLYLYAAHLHPLVRDELVKTGRLPARLDFRSGVADERMRTTWSLRQIADAPFDLAAETARYPMKPMPGHRGEEGEHVHPPEIAELVGLAWRVRNGQAGAPPPGAAYVDRARRLLDEGRGLEALLTLQELSYATGDAPQDLLRLSAERARSDPRMKAIALAMEGGDPEEALAQLEPLDPRSMEGGHIIHVLRASQWLRLLEGKAVLQEFGRMEPLQELALALKANPFLLGAWLDAGTFSFAGWQTDRAWACWDAARAIAPGSAMLEQVNALESALREKHPEFF